MDKHDEEAIKFFKRHPSQNGGVCSTIIFFENENLTVRQTNRECHAFMAYGFSGGNKTLEAIYSSLWYANFYKGIGPGGEAFSKKEMQEASERYWDWIFDKEKSPWRSVLKDSCIIKDGDKYLCFRIHPRGMLAKPVVNLMIASRAPFEYIQRILCWDQAVKNGMTEAEALIFTNAIDVISKDQIKIRFLELGHWPLTLEVCPDKFINANPTLTDNRLVCSGSYVPCDIIWNNARKVRTPQLFMRILAKGEHDNLYRGVFPKVFKNTVSSDLQWENSWVLHMSAEEAVKKLIENRKEWQKT